MKQILQHLQSGKTEVVDVPCPAVKPGQLLIRTRQTLVSAGTERMLIEFGQANWLEKARQQPEKVRQVVDKFKTDGFGPTLAAVRNKLDQPLAPGYCNIGTVLRLGPGIDRFGIGDRVASNGGHAEVVSVPANLCARVPDSVSDEQAAFTVMGAVALQGIRLAQPTLGESIVVTGLGLVGLLTVQLLRAHGCRVLGLDFDPQRLELARQLGAEVVDLSVVIDPVTAAIKFSRDRGVDAVIVAASTKSNDPIHQAALMCRKRGRIVLVGVAGLELSRADFYEKELSLQVSCSYGPGRYDPNYEEKGNDYPLGFVRWTEQRNFEAVLDLLADGRLKVGSLVSHRFPIEQADKAYDLLRGGAPSLGILVQYGDDEAEHLLREQVVALSGPKRSLRPASMPVADVSVGLIGSGNYATAFLIPAFKATGARLKTIASRGGVSGLHAGRKFGFEETTTDTDSIFSDAGINTVVIATRHDSHARFVSQALSAGKHVFVEKPLSLDFDDMTQIEAAREQAAVNGKDCLLMVGFNRRFAPQVRSMRQMLATLAEPKALVMTVNAGAVPLTHWIRHEEIGGGRIVGEGCHFIDLLRYLAGSPIAGWTVQALGASRPGPAADDNVTMTLRFVDGSIGTVHYLSNGHRSYPKERLEVFCGGRVLHLDNFRRLVGYGWPAFSRLSLWRQDKGQRHCVAAFVDAISAGRASPIPYEELAEVSRTAIEIGAALRG